MNTQKQTIKEALRTLGPFRNGDHYYFRIVWPNYSRCITSKSFRISDRWANKIQRIIAKS